MGFVLADAVARMDPRMIRHMIGTSHSTISHQLRTLGWPLEQTALLLSSAKYIRQNNFYDFIPMYD